MADDIHRDYGRRPYISDREYQEQMRGVTDKARDNLYKIPHSESKKPYLPDEYLEMEYRLTPWQFDPFDPIGPPDDPRVEINPEIGPDVVWNDDKDGDHKFLGCDFGFPAGPRIIGPGETTWVGVSGSGGLWNSDGGIMDDPLVSIGVISGPGKLVNSEVGRLNNCPSHHNCLVTIKALGSDEVTGGEYGKDATGLHPIVIEAKTASGASCSWTVWVEGADCPAAETFEWDTENSAETIGDPDSVYIYVKGGEGPYSWSLSGPSGFYLDRSVTTGKTNILFNDGACGAATITVTDSCGEVVENGVRSTVNSSWQQVGDTPNCVLTGEADTPYETAPLTDFEHIRTVGGKRQRETYHSDAADRQCDHSCDAGDCDCNKVAYTVNGGGCSTCIDMPPLFTGNSSSCRFQTYPLPLLTDTYYCYDYSVIECLPSVFGYCGGDVPASQGQCYASIEQLYEEWKCNP